MKKRKINLTVRLRHPTWLCDRIVLGVGTLPSGSYEVGQARRTPTGGALKGAYKETYLYFDLPVECEATLAMAINQGNSWMRTRKKFIDEFVNAAGEVDYYITLSADAHFAEELSVELINECAELKVKVGFEIFFT